MLTKKQVVAVAKDVIAQVKEKKFNVKQQVYLSADLTTEEARTINDLQDLMKIKKPCKVCARGAMVLSKANLYNSCPVEHSSWDDQPYLDSAAEEMSDPNNEEGHNVFPPLLSAMAEVAFEGFKKSSSDPYYGDDHPSVTYLNKEQHKACIRFYKKYPKAETRLLAIMRNIIRNEGKFLPAGLAKRK